MIDKLQSTCGCGQPVKYSSPCGKGSCNKYKHCPTYEELEEDYWKSERDIQVYRNFVNKLDDYFEYRFESMKDQKKVNQLLQDLTEALVRLEEE